LILVFGVPFICLQFILKKEDNEHISEVEEFLHKAVKPVEEWQKHVNILLN